MKMCSEKNNQGFGLCGCVFFVFIFCRKMLSDFGKNLDYFFFVVTSKQQYLFYCIVLYATPRRNNAKTKR